jgi:hypothetical protein
MRPVVAHCHAGLARLAFRTGRRADAGERLAIATAMYREMGMTYWLEKLARDTSHSPEQPYTSPSRSSPGSQACPDRGSAGVPGSTREHLTTTMYRERGLQFSETKKRCLNATYNTMGIDGRQSDAGQAGRPLHRPARSPARGSRTAVAR